MLTSANVLLVDDDPGTVISLGGVLRGVGMHVWTAASGEDALTVAESCPIDLVIADLRLPGMSGIDVIREMRRIQKDAQCLVVTGFASVESVVEALRCGAADYLEKPVFADELITMVDR